MSGNGVLIVINLISDSINIASDAANVSLKAIIIITPGTNLDRTDKFPGCVLSYSFSPDICV